MGITLRHNIIRGNISIGTPPVPAGLPSPADIFGANLVEWWRPEELSGFTPASPLSGNWTSVGSFASNYNQGTPAARPTVISSSYNSLRGMQFDGAVEFLQSDRPKNDYKFLSSGEGFQFIVLESLDQSNSGRIISNMDLDLSNRSGFLILNHSSDEIRVRTSDNLGATFNIAISTGTGTYSENQLNLIFYQNNIPSSGNTSPTSGELGINSSSLNYQNILNEPVGNDDPDNGINFGRSVGSAAFFEGILFEHGIVNRQSTPTERANLLTYLQTKYGGTFPI